MDQPASPPLLSLRLRLAQPGPVPARLAERWAALIQTAGPDAAPYLIFLAELLGLLDDDPLPQFACTAFDSSAFSVDERWTLTTRHIRLRREISECMSESWQSMDTEIDMVEITGLPGSLFLDWEGDWSNWPGGLTAGNLPARLEPAILQLAHSLFRQVNAESRAMSPYESLRARLKRLPSEPFDPAEIDLYAQALGDESDEVALAALERLRSAGRLDEPILHKAVLARIAQWQRGTHARATLVRSLGRPGARHNIAPLTKLLRDGNSSVEAAAAEALGEIGSAAAVPAIARSLRGKVYETRLAGLVALDKLATPEQWPGLVPYLIPVLRDENPHLQGLAAEMLSQLDDPRLIRPFTACLATADDWTLSWIIPALGRWRADSAAPKLRALVRSGVPAVRAAAAEALRQIESGQ